MVGGWHRLLGQVVAVLSAQHSHCIYSCSELGPAAHLQSHVNSFVLLHLVVMGLLYMASPNGCQHSHIPAQAMALPSEGGIELLRAAKPRHSCGSIHEGQLWLAQYRPVCSVGV